MLSITVIEVESLTESGSPRCHCGKALARSYLTRNGMMSCLHFQSQSIPTRPNGAFERSRCAPRIALSTRRLCTLARGASS
jgi:hypothetical protein